MHTVTCPSFGLHLATTPAFPSSLDAGSEEFSSRRPPLETEDHLEYAKRKKSSVRTPTKRELIHGTLLIWKETDFMVRTE